MEKTREFTVVKKEFLGTIRVQLHRTDTDTTDHVINTIRRMETNTTLYAAGGFAPLLVLLNQLPFITENLSSFGKKLTLISMALFAISGVILVLYRAVYANIKRTKVELFRAGIKSERFKVTDTEEYELVVFESQIWVWLLIVAFVAMPVGWLVMGWMVTLQLLGN